jgi:ABC-type uncharacterized transport system auxiliary subunit
VNHILWRSILNEPWRPVILIAFGAVCVALSGCATTRYVTTYCLSHDQTIPAEPPKVKGQLTGQADKDLEIVAGSAIRLRAWGEGLNIILEGCQEPNTEAAPK